MPYSPADYVENLEPGKVLAERYQIAEKLGTGSMGTVYRVWDQTVRNEKALKVIPAHQTTSQIASTQIPDEIRLAQKVSHQNVCQIYNAEFTHGSDQNKNGVDLILLSMELVQGPSLRQILEAKKTISLEKARNLALQICRGLAAIHEQGICHRDLKPENILYDETRDTVKISDFGIAIQAWHTIEGASFGTPFYMAHELREDPPRVSKQSDIYALGLILFELFAGTFPFAATTLQECAEWHWEGERRPPSEFNSNIPPHIDSIILRCLSKHPDERPESAQIILNFLDSVSTTSKLADRVVVSADLYGYSDLARSLTYALKSYGIQHLDRDIREVFHEALRDTGLKPDSIHSKFSGDGAILLFETSEQAHSFASNLHKKGEQLRQKSTELQDLKGFELENSNWFYRVGIATGSVELGAYAHQFSGLAVTTAVRLERSADAGQTVISSKTYEDLKTSDPHAAQDYGPEERAPGKRKEIYLARRTRHTYPVPKELLPVALKAFGFSGNDSELESRHSDLARTLKGKEIDGYENCWHFFNAIDAMRFAIFLWDAYENRDQHSHNLPKFGIVSEQSENCQELASKLASVARRGTAILSIDAFQQTRSHVAFNKLNHLVAASLGKYRVFRTHLDLGEFSYNKGSDKPASEGNTTTEDLPSDGEFIRLEERGEKWIGIPRPGDLVQNAEGWRTVEKIGEGAFGEVWLAKSVSNPNKSCAFKFFLNSESQSAAKQEVEILRALSDHPAAKSSTVKKIGHNLKVEPFFIQYQFAEFGNLAEWDENDRILDRLSIEKRIEIASEIALKIQNIHDAGILHRDLKPSNILVFEDDSGRTDLRLTDFGLSLNTTSNPENHDRSTYISNSNQPRSAHTSITWKYLAPEIQDGGVYTASSEVYSLGVLCFQIITGNLRQGILSDWKALILSERGSNFAEEIGKRVAIRNLETMLHQDPKLRPDIHQVVEILSGFSQDVLEEVERRRKRWFKTTLLVTLSALALCVSTFTVWRLYEKEKFARENLVVALDFITDSFEVADPTDLTHPKDPKGEDITVSQLLDLAYERQKDLLKDQPSVQGSVLNTIGSIYRNLGLWRKAEIALDEGLKIHQGIRDPLGQRGVAESLQSKGQLQLYKSEYQQAIETFREALKIREGRSADKNPASLSEVLSGLSVALTARGDYDEAERVAERALKEAKSLLGPNETAEDRARVASALSELSGVQHAQGKTQKAEESLKSALSLTDLDYKNHPQTAALWNNLALILMESPGHVGEARAMLEKSLQIRMRTLGEEHPLVVDSYINLGVLSIYSGDVSGATENFEVARNLQRKIFGDTEYLGDAAIAIGEGFLDLILGQLEEAEEKFRHAWDIQRSILGSEHKDIAITMTYLADVHRYQGELKQAEDLLEAAEAMQGKLLVPYSREYALTLNTQGILFNDQAKFDQAEEKFCSSLEIWKHLDPKGSHPETIAAKRLLAGVFSSQGLSAKAEPLYREVLGAVRSTQGKEHPDTAIAMGDLAFLLIGEADLLSTKKGPGGAEATFAEAALLLNESLDIYRAIYGTDDNPDVIRTLKNRGLLYERWNQLRNAERDYNSAISLEEKAPDLRFNLAKTLSHMARLQLKLGNPERALADSERAISIFMDSLNRDHWRVANVRSIQAATMVALGDLNGIEAELIKTFEILNGVKGTTAFYTRDALERIVTFYGLSEIPQERSKYEDIIRDTLTLEFEEHDSPICPPSVSP